MNSKDSKSIAPARFDVLISPTVTEAHGDLNINPQLLAWAVRSLGCMRTFRCIVAVSATDKKRFSGSAQALDWMTLNGIESIAMHGYDVEIRLEVPLDVPFDKREFARGLTHEISHVVDIVNMPRFTTAQALLHGVVAASAKRVGINNEPIHKWFRKNLPTERRAYRAMDNLTLVDEFERAIRLDEAG